MKFFMIALITLLLVGNVFAETFISACTKALNSAEKYRKEEISLINQKSSEQAFQALSKKVWNLKNTWRQNCTQYPPDSLLLLRLKVQMTIEELSNHIWSAKMKILMGDKSDWVVENSQGNAVRLDHAPAYDASLKEARAILAKYKLPKP